MIEVNFNDIGPIIQSKFPGVIDWAIGQVQLTRQAAYVARLEARIAELELRGSYDMDSPDEPFDLLP